jgi:hypothetical protein
MTYAAAIGGKQLQASSWPRFYLRPLGQLIRAQIPRSRDSQLC